MRAIHRFRVARNTGNLEPLIISLKDQPSQNNDQNHCQAFPTIPHIAEEWGLRCVTPASFEFFLLTFILLLPKLEQMKLEIALLFLFSFYFSSPFLSWNYGRLSRIVKVMGKSPIEPSRREGKKELLETAIYYPIS